MTAPAALPFRRCPSCGALDWPPKWRATHRRDCPHEHITPDRWETT